MVNLLDLAKVYSAWNLEAVEKINSISEFSADPLERDDYGRLEVRIHIKTGGVMYFKLSENSTLSEGDSLDLSKCVIIKLSRPQSDPIYKISLEADLTPEEKALLK